MNIRKRALQTLIDRRAITNTRVVVITVLVVLTLSASVIIIGVATKYANIQNPLSSLGNGGGQTTVVNNGYQTNSQGQSFYVGQLTVAVSYVDTADQTTVPTLTSPAFTLYNTQGQTLASITSVSQIGNGITGLVSGTSKSIQLNPADQGKFFMRVYAGSAHFVDVRQFTKQGQVKVSDCKWTAIQGGSPSDGAPIDITADNIWDLLCTVDASGVQVSSGQTPTVTLTIPVIPDDSGSISWTAPSALTAQGTTTATLTSEWKLSGFTNKDGADLSRVYVTSSQTTALWLNPQSLQVSGFTSISSSNFNQATCGTSSSGISNCWDFYNPAGSSLQPAVGLLVVTGVSSSTALYFDLTYVRSFGVVGNTATLVMSIYAISPSGTITTLTSSQSLYG